MRNINELTTQDNNDILQCGEKSGNMRFHAFKRYCRKESDVSIQNEKQLMEYLRKHWKEIFPTAKDVMFNYPITGYFHKQNIGYADIFMRIYQRLYVIEIKYTTGLENNRHGCRGQEFWESLKVLGYAKAIELCSNKTVMPTIMIPKKALDIDKLIIIGELKLSYITFEYIDNKLQFNFYR